MMKKKDWLEVGVGAAILVAYFGAWITGNIPEDTPILVHLLIGSAIVAIFGDNLLTYLEATKEVT